MDYNTISSKPAITLKSDVDGSIYTKCIDLLAKRASSIDLNDINDIALCVIDETFIGRPDLVSLVYYGSPDYGDFICKANGISNPFELNKDDVLIVPSIVTMKKYFSSSIDSVSKLVSENDSIIDEKKDKYKKKKTESRSPNELTIGENNFVIDRSNNIVFY